MASTVNRLATLRVTDLMATPVVSVRASQTICEAAAELTGRKLAAAPVVDETGRCVGMISAVDFLRREAERCAVDQAAAGAPRIEIGSTGVLQIAETDHDRVARYMTSAVQSIAPERLAVDAAREMCALHVHHLPVLDAAGRPVGMVSSLDLVSALVGIVEE